ncbi:hypothetical protein B5M44_25755 [Shinella sumterensis]|uniref:substrate-binding domain-containing protein n=1 Tax=Shinella sumterensis TaxID=1967501 RepID=UPI00106E8F20|nr:substrate-binding domain-containing protein [Shinella sumterensis]MCD1265404.1 substrate-binding domain-containing protein [Shinella sumterensis]TFE93023.1 hypothetical protein B5M44_25755 [Shinella sumterensis]
MLQTNRNRRLPLIAGVMAIAAGLSGLWSPAQAEEARKPLKIMMISHSPASDTYFVDVIKGLEQAGKDLGVEVQYRGTDANLNDPNQQRRNIEAAIAAGPDGLIISNPTPTSLNEVITKATGAGIPVVLFNQGGESVKEVHALTFVGDDPAIQGRIAGEQYNGLGSKHVLVITTPTGALPFVDARVNGLKEAFSGKVSLAEVPLNNINDANRIKTITETQLQKDPSIDAVFSVGSCCIAPMLEARNNSGDKGKSMRWGTIDLTTAAVDGLKSKNLDFDLHAQQYAQGYYPVVVLSLYLRQGIVPATDAFITGPAVITPENIDRLMSLQQQ